MSTLFFILTALILIFALVLFACSRSPRWEDVMIVHDGRKGGSAKRVYRSEEDRK